MSDKKVMKIGFGYIRLFISKIMFGKRLEIKSIRQNLCLDTDIFIGKKAFMSMGKVRCNSNMHLECYLGEMTIGNVTFNRNCIISCRHKIQIGDNCFFGPNVCVYDHDHIYTVDGVTPNEYKCSEIIIEDGCWICAGAIILRGTHIGRNSVIQAGAVVKGNIPPNSLVEPGRENRIIPTALFADKQTKGNRPRMSSN